MGIPRDWIHCPDCDEEFSVISPNAEVSYCPFCGEYMTLDEELEDLDDDDLDL